MTQETVAAVLIVWLIGAIVGWCAGWAAHGEQNRSWYSGLVRQLAQTRVQLAEALDELKDTRADTEGTCPLAPAVVHFHLATPPPLWAAQQPSALTTIHAVGAMPGLPADGSAR
jgi:hypothetical protein